MADDSMAMWNPFKVKTIYGNNSGPHSLDPALLVGRALTEVGERFGGQTQSVMQSIARNLDDGIIGNKFARKPVGEFLDRMMIWSPLPQDGARDIRDGIANTLGVKNFATLYIYHVIDAERNAVLRRGSTTTSLPADAVFAVSQVAHSLKSIGDSLSGLDEKGLVDPKFAVGILKSYSEKERARVTTHPFPGASAIGEAIAEQVSERRLIMANAEADARARIVAVRKDGFAAGSSVLTAAIAEREVATAARQPYEIAAPKMVQDVVRMEEVRKSLPVMAQPGITVQPEPVIRRDPAEGHAGLLATLARPQPAAAQPALVH